MGGIGEGGAEDAQAQASAYHKLFRRTTHLVQPKSDRKLSGLPAVQLPRHRLLDRGERPDR